VLPDNRRMLQRAQHLGFRIRQRGDGTGALELGKDVD
jgi:hypothetical protein